MMYPDIDLYLPPTTPERLLGVAAELGKHNCVERINYRRGGPGELKNGLYLKPVVTHGAWERPWKIDIWSLPSPIVERSQAELDGLRTRMTPKQRSVILDTKYRLLTDEGRTPGLSGIYIYRVVIDNGLEELEDILEFLRRNGVTV